MSKSQVAILAAGCFWCIQEILDRTLGVIKTEVGYTGSDFKNPNYEQVCDGDTGHYEAIYVEFDPDILSYEKLIIVYLSCVDPENPYGQFCDIGTQYRLAIFYKNLDEKARAKKILDEYKLNHRLKIMHIDLLPSTKFYAAESYHQKFYEKNPSRYLSYKEHSGRKERLKELERKKTNS